jgi:hypothetical protein
MFKLCNVAISPTRGASGKLLDLFLVSNPNDVDDFHQIDGVTMLCFFFAAVLKDRVWLRSTRI